VPTRILVFCTASLQPLVARDYHSCPGTKFTAQTREQPMQGRRTNELLPSTKCTMQTKGPPASSTRRSNQHCRDQGNPITTVIKQTFKTPHYLLQEVTTVFIHHTALPSLPSTVSKVLDTKRGPHMQSSCSLAGGGHHTHSCNTSPMQTRQRWSHSALEHLRHAITRPIVDAASQYDQPPDPLPSVHHDDAMSSVMTWCHTHDDAMLPGGVGAGRSRPSTLMH
jgi:hypothetical protein